MTGLKLPAPNERQKLFLLDRHKYIAFGGARGGGKSWAVRTKAIMLAYRFPGIRIGIVRRTYQELKSNHIDPLRETLGTRVRYRDVDHEFTFPNGSKIFLRQTQNEKDITKFQGTEYDVLFIDEATQLTETQYDKIKVTVRGVNGMPKRIYLTCNPGGVGHNWVKRLFVDRKYKPNEHEEEYAFIKSRVTDNKALMKADPDYIRQLEALPPKLRRAWLEGDWNIFEGQFFEEFREQPDTDLCEEAGITPAEAKRARRFTHVIEPFEIPGGWTVFRSFDWGFRRPFSCDYWALDYDGTAYLILQMYGCTGEANEGVKWPPQKVFAKIRELEDTHPWLRGRSIMGVADPAIFDAQRGTSIADVADSYGIYFSKGDNKRIPGWMQCHYRLTFDRDGYPAVYFFESCRHAIRTLPLVQYSETTPEDLDTDGEDHFCDSMRYFFMSRPIAPRIKEEKRAREADPLDIEW